MGSQEIEDNSHRREELRGVFAVGVIAVLAAIIAAPEKFNIQSTYTVTLPSTPISFSFSLFSLFNLVIFSWIGYAIMMVFAYSDDIVKSARFRRILKFAGLGFLLTGPFLFGVISLTTLTIAYMIAYYPMSIFLLIVALIGFIVTISFLYIHGRYRVHIEKR